MRTPAFKMWQSSHAAIHEHIYRRFYNKVNFNIDSDVKFTIRFSEVG